MTPFNYISRGRTCPPPAPTMGLPKELSNVGAPVRGSYKITIEANNPSALCEVLKALAHINAAYERPTTVTRYPDLPPPNL